MYKKGIFFLIIFLIGLLVVSSVSATEDVESNLISLDDSSIDDISIQSADEDFNEGISDDNPVISENEGESGDENTKLKTFTDLNAAINGNDDSDIYLEENFTFDSNSESQFSKGINITRSVTIHGNNNTIDANNGARVFNILSHHVTLKNIVFINGKFDGGKFDGGGAIYCSGYNCSVMDCSFVNNSAMNRGGAIYSLYSSISVIGSSFVNNEILNDPYGYGGAIHCSDTNASIVNCSFVNNSAHYGGAIKCSYNSICSVVGCSFVNNSAVSGGAIENEGNSSFLNCSFVNNSAKTYAGGAILNSANLSFVGCSFVKNFANDSGGVIFSEYGSNSSIEDCSFVNNSAGYGGAIALGNNGNYVNCSVVGCSFVNNSANYGGAILFDRMENGVIGGMGLAINSSFSGNIANSSGGAIYGGNYTNCSFKNNIAKGIGNDWINSALEHKIIYPKFYAPSVTVVYGNTKYLVVTMRDGLGEVISGAEISIDLNGYKTYITDKNGQVKVSVGKLVPKTYTAEINFPSNEKYLTAHTTAKVVVKKATPKFVAAAKTFKLKVKTKKYTITLKNNKNNGLKNAKLTLKVNGKTYKAKTNTKGKATFKITKLTKKGTFKATISFAGSKYYNKISKKVKITVKK